MVDPTVRGRNEGDQLEVFSEEGKEKKRDEPVLTTPSLKQNRSKPRGQSLVLISSRCKKPKTHTESTSLETVSHAENGIGGLSRLRNEHADVVPLRKRKASKARA